jgi:DNA-binding MarR family transcriptional regulator
MPAPRQAEYDALADFSHRIRRFLAFSEDATRAAGLTPQQHQLLLAVKGAPGGTAVSIRDAAEALLLRHHSVVGLVDRLERLGWLKRTRDKADRRRVQLRLTGAGDRVLATLTAEHRRELRAQGPALVQALTRILGARSGR